VNQPPVTQVPPGLVVITTHGSVTGETCESYAATRVLAIEKGLKNISWAVIHASLVDKARNDSVLQLLGSPAQWLLFIDGDMQWKPEALLQILKTAYSDIPFADLVGAWCPLRGWPYLPTIDPGSGHWEPVAPGGGPIEVMRTGSAFILIKRHVFEKMPPPWYATNFVPRALDALQAVNAFANSKFDGRNPLRDHPDWAVLERCAVEASSSGRPPDYGFPWDTLGEDSGFCDRAKQLGFRIFVNTDCTVNHVDKLVITPERHLDAMRERNDSEAYAAGLTRAV